MYRVNEKLGTLINRFKQPDYTGDNRCLSCTILNTIIALAGTILIALVSAPAALVAFVLAVILIGLRGYLVPGTPTLVTYLPDWIHERIGPGAKQLEQGQQRASAESELDIEATLRQSAIIEDCNEKDDLCLTPEFHSEWRSAMETVANRPNQRGRLAKTLAVSPEKLSFEETEAGWYVYVGDVRAGRWLSEAAFVADLASEQLLASWLPDWDQLQDADRTQLLVSLRTFIEACPSCGGTVQTDESVRRSCCRDDIVSVTGACSSCGATVFNGNVS